MYDAAYCLQLLESPTGRSRERDVFSVDPETGCWNWWLARNEHGYGQVVRDGFSGPAHRWVYDRVVGPVPDGMVLDHLCRNRGCVNPAHLEVVTQRENVLRGEGLTAQNAQKTHCPKGHPYEGDNLMIRPCGRRRCRACTNEQQNARNLRKKIESQLGMSAQLSASDQESR